MQSTLTQLRWSLRSCLVLTLLVAVLIVSAVQVAHWCGHEGVAAIAQVAPSSDSLCPICYSVPVSHAMTMQALDMFYLDESVAELAQPPEQQGTQPEFHLHTRPPPTAA